MSTIKLSRVTYLRDLWGIKNSDNKSLKKGMVFLSSSLYKIKDKQKRILKNKYGISTVIDLRSQEELDEKPDQEFCRYYSVEILDSIDNPSVNKYNRKDILEDMLSEDGGVQAHLENIYRKMISSNRGIDNFKKFFDIMLSEDAAIDIHCTQGKDRTGLSASLFLFALGFSKEDVIDNYLRFNDHHFIKRNILYVLVAIRYLSIKKARGLKYTLVAKKDFILAAIDEMNKFAGSVDLYLKNVLELDENKINLLKGKYLQND